MNIDSIRNRVRKHLNIPHLFVYCGSRGQYEKFYGYINKLYPRIFTIITTDGKTKAVSYSDFALQNIKIC